jgi:peptide-methionine (R)-S-oxide reductase
MQTMTRRNLLGSALAAGASAYAWDAVAAGFEVTHSDAEWRALLTPAQYAVLRQSGTEPPYSSPLNDEHRPGTFACAGCGLALFRLRDEVRERHRLAELLGAARRRGRERA